MSAAVTTRPAIVRALVGVHAARFIGIVFLALTARGELSARFGQRAGWGDIVVAALAVVLALIGPGAGSVRRWAFLTWTALGFAVPVLLATHVALFRRLSAR